MIICPVSNISNVRMIKCLEKVSVKVLFSLEKHVNFDSFNELSKNVKNKEIIRNILEPSVYNNIYYAINYLLAKNSKLNSNGYLKKDSIESSKEDSRANYKESSKASLREELREDIKIHSREDTDYFTIIDIDDEISDDFEHLFLEFVNILRLRKYKLGRFLGPKIVFEDSNRNAIKTVIINPREYGYYYSSVFHIDIFKNMPSLSFLNPIHADNFIVGYALEHTDKMLWLPKYFGYIHFKADSSENSEQYSNKESKENLEKDSKLTLRESLSEDSELHSKNKLRENLKECTKTDSNTISQERLEDTLFMYCLQSFSFKNECYKLPKLTITIATQLSRINKLKQTLFNLSQIRAIKNKVAKVVIQCACKSDIIEMLCNYYEFEFRFIQDDKYSYNKINLTDDEKDGFVITLDDDFIYDTLIIEKLFKSYILYNRNVIVSNEVRELNSNEYQNCSKTSKTNNKYNSVIGGSGVLYPCGFFKIVDKFSLNNDLKDKYFKYCDDLYFTLVALSNNILIKTSKYGIINKDLGLESDSLFERARNENFKEYNDAIKIIRLLFK